MFNIRPDSIIKHMCISSFPNAPQYTSADGIQSTLFLASRPKSCYRKVVLPYRNFKESRHILLDVFSYSTPKKEVVNALIVSAKLTDQRFPHVSLIQIISGH